MSIAFTEKSIKIHLPCVITGLVKCNSYAPKANPDVNVSIASTTRTIHGGHAVQEIYCLLFHPKKKQEKNERNVE